MSSHEVSNEKVDSLLSLDINISDNILNSKMMRPSTPGIILTTKPIKPLINKIIVGPGIHIHQQNDGRIIIGEQGGPGMLHDERLKNKPNTFPNHDYEKKHQDRILKIVKEINLPEYCITSKAIAKPFDKKKEKLTTKSKLQQLK